jgi:hypothetical protein
MMRDWLFYFVVIASATLGVITVFRPHYHCTLIDGGRFGAKIEERIFPLWGDDNCLTVQDCVLHSDCGQK